MIATLEQQMQVAEKAHMNKNDVTENQARISTLKNLRNFRILEKHANKARQIDEYQQSVHNLSKLA